MNNRLAELVNDKNIMSIKSELIKMTTADIAEAINHLNAKHSLIVFRLLDKGIAADVFSQLLPIKQSQLSASIPESELKTILEDLFFDDMIDYLEEMPANVVKRILKNTDETKRNYINMFLNYPSNSAGSIMTIEYLDLKADMTVKAALEHIRTKAPVKETVYTCYVVNQNRILEGIVSLKDIVLASPDMLVRNIMNTNIIYVNTLMDQEAVAEDFKRYDLLTMPVVDNETHLVGIITIDDIVDVIDEENTEDFHRMAAIQSSGEGYLTMGVISLAKRRILWLLILMISATLSGRIIKKYDDLLQSMVILAAFIPRLMDTGGNAGSQSSTLIIRGIALGEINMGDLFRVIWKEIRVSIIVGLTLSAFNFLQVLIFSHGSYLVAATVSLTLLVTVITAKVIGGSLPIVAKGLGVDPAMMASPIITTIVDAIALICYFAIASHLIGIG